MDDKATAAKIVADAMNSVCETSMESAIVAALEAARREGAGDAFVAHAASPNGFNYAKTASDISDGICKEMENGPIMGGKLWWGEMYRLIGLNLCKAFNAGRADMCNDAKGGIIDCTGEVPCVRRTTGKLTLTEDGVVIGSPYQDVWAIHGRTGKPYETLAYHASCRKCWSTEEDAKAAMEGGKA